MPEGSKQENLQQNDAEELKQCLENFYYEGTEYAAGVINAAFYLEKIGFTDPIPDLMKVGIYDATKICLERPQEIGHWPDHIAMMYVKNREAASRDEQLDKIGFELAKLIAVYNECTGRFPRASRIYKDLELTDKAQEMEGTAEYEGNEFEGNFIKEKVSLWEKAFADFRRFIDKNPFMEQAERDELLQKTKSSIEKKIKEILPEK
ncbi:MAG: hypothetical protein Q8Q48_01485 [Candidatus Staskawiczbacteria bacterium]|nr:hypothetical protein [Candidatus Staskawiczbacteria bacterium]